MSKQAHYLGDSVYVAWDGYMLELTTNNGLGASNRIYLEPGVLRALVEYVAGLSTQQAATVEDDDHEDE
jgi:hypothetical protein